MHPRLTNTTPQHIYYQQLVFQTLRISNSAATLLTGSTGYSQRTENTHLTCPNFKTLVCSSLGAILIGHHACLKRKLSATNPAIALSTTVRCACFRQAARSLNIQATVLRRQIKQLESDVGEPLLFARPCTFVNHCRCAPASRPSAKIRRPAPLYTPGQLTFTNRSSRVITA